MLIYIYLLNSETGATKKKQMKKKKKIKHTEPNKIPLSRYVQFLLIFSSTYLMALNFRLFILFLFSHTQNTTRTARIPENVNESPKFKENRNVKLCELNIVQFIK